MTFIWPWMLLALLLIPVFVGSYIGWSKRRRNTANALGPLGQVNNPSGNRLGNRRHLPPLFYLLGLSILLFGLSRPEILVNLPRIEGTVILAFDVSNSMAAEDLSPTRMEAAKAAAQNFVQNQPSTIQLGVVAFSNGGLVVQPSTDDRAAVLSAIDRLNPQGGTSLGQGIFSALNAIAGEAIAIDPAELEDSNMLPDIGRYSSSVVLLLTDGENTSSPDPMAISQLAAEAGVRIYPVGIGSNEGAVVEIDGYSVATQLDETALQAIADLTNGTYYHAEDEDTLQEIYQNVDLQLTIRGEKMEISALLAGISLLFFLTGGALTLLWFGRLPL
jgi:Ca-activated chloride channel family protein